MLQHAFNADSATHISVEHCADQIDAVFTHDIWNAKVPVHDLVDAVERVLFIDDRVEQDAKRPDVLLFAAVRFSSKDFGGCVIWENFSIAFRLGKGS